MLFWGKKSPDKTILLLDVESGSVGSALVRLSPGKQPKLFGEARFVVPLGASRSGEQMAKAIEVAAHEAVRNASEIAARVRTHGKVAELGEVEHAALFLSAPWGMPNLSEGRPDFLPSITDALATEVARSFGYISSSLYTGAGAAAFGTRATMGEEPCLVCVVTGEITELMRMDKEGVAAHATIPTGSNNFLRTLKSHGNFSEHEARSLLRMGFEGQAANKNFSETIESAAAHFAGHFKDAAGEMLSPGDIFHVRVVAQEPVAEWFARALAQIISLAELFPQGGGVRALRPRHLSPHIAAHAESPDTLLMLAALFVDNHFGVYPMR